MVDTERAIDVLAAFIADVPAPHQAIEIAVFLRFKFA